MSSNPKWDWRSMLAKLTKKRTQSHQRPRSWGSSLGARWASRPPPSWTPAGRSLACLNHLLRLPRLLHLLHLTSVLCSHKNPVEGKSACWESSERRKKMPLAKPAHTVMMISTSTCAVLKKRGSAMTAAMTLESVVVKTCFIVWTKFRLVWCHTNFYSK